MRIKLDPKWTQMLVQWPENGMGYQRVHVRLDSGRLLENVTVFNAEELEVPEDIAADKIIAISTGQET